MSGRRRAQYYSPVGGVVLGLAEERYARALPWSRGRRPPR